MQIKRFEARDMTEALRMVKKEFGGDAVILSAKEFRKKGGLLGYSRQKGVEITAAIDTRETPVNDRFDVQKKSAGSKIQGKKSDEDGQRQFPAPKKPLSDVDDPSPLTYGPSSHLIKPFFADKRALHSIERQLMAQGVDHLIISELLAELVDTVAQRPAKNYVFAFERVLAGRGLVEKEKTLEGKTRTIALTGPSGAGKTTSLAKLAMRHAVEQKMRVGLISMDRYRIAAWAELETYAGLIGVPCEKAWDKQGLERAINRFKHMDVVLIDTPGAGPKDHDIIRETAQMFSLGSAPDEVHLVLSSSTSKSALSEIVAAYDPLSVNRLLFTKLDTAKTLGELLNISLSTGIPISFLSDGRSAADGIRKASVSDIMMRMGVLDCKETFSNIRQLKKKNCSNTGVSDALSGTGEYVANINSDIFHHKSCISVKRINRENIVMFHSMDEAAERLFKPCRMCCSKKTKTDKKIMIMSSERKRSGVC